MIDIHYHEVRAQITRGVDLYGGDFMKAICRAMNIADSNNLVKIYTAWREELNEYYRMGGHGG